MLERHEFPVLFVTGAQRRRTASQTLSRIVEELVVLGHRVVEAQTLIDGRALVSSDPSFGAVILDWDVTAGDGEKDARAVLNAARLRSDRLPVFLMLDHGDATDLSLDVLEQAREVVLVLEDTPAFIAGRIDFAWRRYTETLLPPFFGALAQFANTYEYSMHTPGHAGGAAFRKTPVGKAFYDFYGENLFRTDLSVSVAELGSLLDHSGPVAESERNAARIFGADMTYFVLNGTSTANQIVAHSAIVAGDVVLADRNCHKSLNYALAVTDAIPVYLHPTRNGYGIIGPIPARALEPGVIAQSIAAHPLASLATDHAAVYAVVTNSTYDGLCYDAGEVTRLLGQSVPRIHFDEAWFAYAAFNPLYHDRHAMQVPQDVDSPTLYATQSTHKLLAAFSQGSMIHIRSSDRAPVQPARFNEAYMMHASTSPFYPMIAVLDVAAAMMDGPGGETLTGESIREAIDFRKRIMSLAQAIEDRDGGAGWFFNVWQPDQVRDPASGIQYGFAEAPDELLATEPACWQLENEAPWHGFGVLPDGFCLLDPIKVTITMPGIDVGGTFARRGIPAQIVTLFLDEQRIEIEKTGDYIMLVLFSIGMTKGKWGTLLDGLLGFKRAYDENMPLRDALPTLVTAHPQRYADLGLADLCDEMHDALRTSRMPALLDSAFDVLPQAELTPGDAYRRLVRGRTDRLPLAAMAERTAAVMVVPYPPGIPILMPGESVGAADGPLLEYLAALEVFDKHFPGFEHDIHGVARDTDGNYAIECLALNALPIPSNGSQPVEHQQPGGLAEGSSVPPLLPDSPASARTRCTPAHANR
jgi:arginine decarboxylase